MRLGILEGVEEVTGRVHVREAPFTHDRHQRVSVAARRRDAVHGPIDPVGDLEPYPLALPGTIPTTPVKKLA